MFNSNHSINLVMAENGVMIDWGGEQREIFTSEPEQLARLIAKILGHFEGYYSGDFAKQTIDIKIRAKENWDDNEGI